MPSEPPTHCIKCRVPREAGPPPVNALPITLAIRQVSGSHAHRQFRIERIERVVAGSWVKNLAGDLQDRWIEPAEDSDEELLAQFMDHGPPLARLSQLDKC